MEHNIQGDKKKREAGNKNMTHLLRGVKAMNANDTSRVFDRSSGVLRYMSHCSLRLS